MASITLRELISDTASATIHFDSGDLEVVYSPSLLSPASIERMQKAQKDSTDTIEKAKSLVAYLSEVLVSWNMEDDDGNPMPITFDTLYQFPVSVLTRILTELQAKDSVGEVSGATSKAA